MRLALAVLLALVVAAPAHAGWKIDRALQIANRTWHSPCNGGVQTRWRALPAGVAGRAVTGRSQAPDGYERCVIYLAQQPPSNVRVWGQRVWAWEPLCHTILHEMGHIAGFLDPRNTEDPAHSSNPRSVMADRQDIFYALNEEWVGTDRRCHRPSG